MKHGDMVFKEGIFIMFEEIDSKKITGRAPPMALTVGKDQRVSFSTILASVTIVCKIPTSTMLGPRRDEPIAHLRHILMFLAYSDTDLSFPQIAKKIRRKDHTTIIHGVRSVVQLYFTDSYLRNQILLIRKYYGLDGDPPYK